MNPGNGWFPVGAAAHLVGMGLTLERDADGELFLGGLQHLSIEDRARALQTAKANRLLILSELERCGGTLSNPLVLHYRAHYPNYLARLPEMSGARPWAELLLPLSPTRENRGGHSMKVLIDSREQAPFAFEHQKYAGPR